MKSRIQSIFVVVLLAVGTSTAAWSQQVHRHKSQAGKQQLAGNETNPDPETSSAKDEDNTNRKNGDARDSIDTVGHLGLSGAVVTNLRTLEDASVQLLEVTDSTAHTLNLVDVTDPTHPKLVQRIHEPAELKNARLEIEVGHAALFAEMQGTSASPAPATITLVDLSDPENRKTVRQFANVSSIVEDRARKLIYVANPDGLWVLHAYSSADHKAVEKQFDEMLRSAQSGG